MGREIVCMQTVLRSSSYPQTAFVGASMATPATVTYSSMKSILTLIVTAVGRPGVLSTSLDLS